MHESPSGPDPMSMSLKQRLADALPPVGPTIAGALLWGCGMALSLHTGLEIAMEGLTSHRTALLTLYFAGGVLSFPLAYYFVRFAALDKTAETRFSAAFVALTVATLGCTAALSALAYWSNETATIGRVSQLAVASAAAIYQFAVIGTRYYLPLGVLLLVAASLWLARTTR